MRRYIWAVVAIFGLASAALAEGERVISTTGFGSVDAVPDMATLEIGVTHQAEAAGEALRLTSDAVRQVIATLQDAGIAAGDMQTQGLSVQPVWSRQTQASDAAPRITGFVARNGLMIRVRALDSLGSVLDAVVSDGANTFDGLQFALQDPAAAMAEARARAVADAMTKAQELASAAGVKLGPVQSISETAGGARPVMMQMEAARMASDVPVAAGEVSLSAQVSMLFEISDD